MTDITLALEANQELLEQGLDLLVRLSEPQFVDPRGDWAPVGAQYRHVLEHYQCFFAGLPGAAIDYDSRARDRQIESSRNQAVAATRTIRDQLGGLLGRRGAEPVRIQLRTTTYADGPEWSESTLLRELQFLVSHTVHHFALIKLLLTSDGLELPAEFGTAPSTLAHAARHRVHADVAR